MISSYENKSVATIEEKVAACKLLTTLVSVHSAAEEACLYPMMKKMGPTGELVSFFKSVLLSRLLALAFEFVSCVHCFKRSFKVLH